MTIIICDISEKYSEHIYILGTQIENIYFSFLRSAWGKVSRNEKQNKIAYVFQKKKQQILKRFAWSSHQAEPCYFLRNLVVYQI